MVSAWKCYFIIFRHWPASWTMDMIWFHNKSKKRTKKALSSTYTKSREVHILFTWTRNSLWNVRKSRLFFNSSWSNRALHRPIYRYTPSLWAKAQQGSKKKKRVREEMSTFIYIQSYFSHFWTTAAGAPTVTCYNIDRLHIIASFCLWTHGSFLTRRMTYVFRSHGMPKYPHRAFKSHVNTDYANQPNYL